MSMNHGVRTARRRRRRGCGPRQRSKLNVCRSPMRPYIILKRRLHSALFLARDAGFLQIELSLHAPARLVSDLAVSKQLVDIVAFGSNQFRPDFRGGGGGLDSI